MLYKLIDNKKNIERILNWKYPFLYIIYVKLIQIKKNVLYYMRWKFKWFKNIEWIKKYNIDKNSFSFDKRKKWISAFWRLHNSEDFLEESIESHIKFFDEIILVNNNSTDNTEKICKKLKNKYPKKIKLYNYPFKISKIWSNEYNNTNENSINSLSYYYNWTLSKTNYKYAIKLDDDHICINSQLKKITKYIRKNWLDSFLQTPLINIYTNNGKIKNSYYSLKSCYAWLFWDFWFFPVSEKSYFIKLKWAESLIFPFKIKNEKISFLHLKWLKKWMWLNNYWVNIQDKLKERINHNNYKNINNKYIKILKNNWIQ